jgi:hypothetical protein
MGILDQAVSGAISKLAGNTSAFKIDSSEQEPYKVTSTNWYKSLPYGFAFYDINSKESSAPKSVVYLPISPNNITVTTSFATNVVTTLYGIVEEHSEVRYHDIMIAGNTGYAPRFVAPFEQGTKNSDSQSLGRTAFSGGGVDFGGFLPEVSNTINQALDIFQDVTDTLNGGPSNPTGIQADKSGYVAFHNLRKFFLKYKQDAAQMGTSPSVPAFLSPITIDIDTRPQRQVHPIQFLNYKDGVKYDCVPISFTMQRSADNPLLYNYTIRLRAFNEQNVNEKLLAVDQRKAELGLDGLEGQSLFTKMTSIAGNAATAISALF